MEVEENGTASKPIKSLQDEFPWAHFGSLAMHKLINLWGLQSSSKDINLQDERSTSIKLPPKVLKCNLSFYYTHK